MTDKPNSYVLGKGRLYFEPARRPAMHPALGAGYEATVKLSEDIYEWFVNEALFDFRVISIVGYNPQMLLPAPSPFNRPMSSWTPEQFIESMQSWATEQMMLPYMEVARKTLYDAVGIDAHPLLVVGADFSAVESKVLNYMYATFIHESDIGDRKPVGKIELFDYDDHAVINLEGSGELPGRMSISDALFQPKVQPLRGKQPSYLDHDPTKRHKRRKKK